MSITMEEALNLPTIKQSLQKTLQNPTLRQVSKEERNEQIIADIFSGLEITTIAKKYELCRDRIYDVFEDWAKTKQVLYLQVEWFKQYEQIKQVSPKEAFQALTKIMTKLVEKQAKIEVNVTQNTTTNISNQVNELIKFSREQP